MKCDVIKLRQNMVSESLNFPVTHSRFIIKTRGKTRGKKVKGYVQRDNFSIQPQGRFRCLLDFVCFFLFFYYIIQIWVVVT